LYMVGIQGIEGEEKLCEAKRSSTAEPFSTPQVIEAVRNQPSPKFPWLADDGLRLVFQRRDEVGDYSGLRSSKTMQQTEFVFCRRGSPDEPWTAPVRLPLADDPSYTDALTCPSLSSDGLTIFFCQGDSRFAQVMYATRSSLLKAFTDPRPALVDGEPLLGQAPRYVAATEELFLSRERGTPRATQGRDLWVLKDFVPEEHAEVATVTARAPWPKDSQLFGRHRYRFYRQQVSWHEARARCESLGGYLAVIDSPEENALIAKLVAKAKWLDAWIGISDELEEDDWVSVRGERIRFTNWHPGQPNNKRNLEHFGLISGRFPGPGGSSWDWHDQPAQSLPGHRPGYVCEWDAEE
jgi:hypothetical protein